VVGNTSKIEMTIVLHEGPAGQVSAATVAGFPVSLTGKYRGQDLGTFESMDGTVTAKWVY
jgi:hypothetical protein